jgi:hypothetical protein
MKKIIFFPISLALFFVAARAYESTTPQETTFEEFLKLFPKEGLPFEISLKALKKEYKAYEIPFEFDEQVLARKVMAKFIPTVRPPHVWKNEITGKEEVSLSGTERGTTFYKPFAKIETEHFYIACNGHFLMSKANMSRYSLYIFDKKGKFLLETCIARHDGSIIETGRLDKNLNLFLESYKVKKENGKIVRTDLVGKTQQNLYDLLAIEQAEKDKLLIKPNTKTDTSKQKIRTTIEIVGSDFLTGRFFLCLFFLFVGTMGDDRFWDTGCLAFCFLHKGFFEHPNEFFFSQKAIAELRTFGLIDSRQDAFFAQIVFQLIENQFLFSICQSSGSCNIQQNFHFRFHFVDILSAFATRPCGAITQLTFECVVIHFFKFEM